MYYIDTNILIYANDTESPFHQSASEIFNGILSREKAIINEIVLTEFFSIITDSRKMAFPWSTAQAKHYIKILLEAVQELHFINIEIINDALISIKQDIKRYRIYDHLIAHSMKFYGISRIVTLNGKDFEKYGFIKEIIIPERSY
ncbi:MAG TPA: type II toxin-antitoxin system VapC family toxin [Candidatus Kapabacteria bacterium]|nr:type II toxin-antitoxin system VapC family toxin [Candidatus Kapabacteria bacterium]